MFTGIIKDVGTIISIKKGSKSQVMTIETSILEDVNIGDSIATNGLCLTVTSKTNQQFSVDIMAESLRRSNLGKLQVGSKVNLEKAMAMGDRFGGHMVSGHIDDVGIISHTFVEDNATWVEIDVPEHLRKYCILKGSIAIDGISLTVSKLTNKGVSVSIIPHTKDQTTLLNKKVGDPVNLEMDMMIKYVEKLMKPVKDNLTEETLKTYGY
ncbi:MAG: riboflavin synthase [Acholeplasmataceae bacterium]